MKGIIGMLIALSLVVSLLQGQEKKVHSRWIVGPSLGYQYQNANFLKASLWGLTDLGYANYLRIDGGANMNWKERKTYVVPEFGLTYYLGAKLAWPFVKAEVTPYTVTPKIGVGLFNLVEFATGYGFDMKTKDGLGSVNGFSFSLGLNLPLNYHLY
ncbi:hypothetical protein [Sphingobacterium faecale]|uniref:Outer membrane protein beta-barrel domain-containing protein n=1 Tax=Sphingobacterium faecale TaxID=2803775 RepID=A0ABS1R4E3_9SPHI|nr:hypothetical protein [Sphingobacterium faecale]MBL1409577.1 hypothetical protein [Sphingobacterium faecale]